MSTLNYTAQNNKTNIVAKSHDGRNQIVFKPSLTETTYTKFFNAVSGAPGTNHTVEFNLSSNDLFNVNELLLEFTVANLDAVLSQTIFNPWMLFAEMRLLVNGSEVVYYDNSEKLFNAQANYYRQFSEDELFTKLIEIRPTEFTKTFNGETIAPLTSLSYSLPLISVLFPFIKNINRMQGLFKIGVEFRFQPNTNTVATVGRFIRSSTLLNPYTISTIAFQQISLRVLATRHSDALLYNLPYTMMIVPKYDDRMYALNWNSTSSQQRIQLTNDFTFRHMVHGIQLYLYAQDLVTAYNDADCCKVNSGVDLIGWELKYKSRSVVKLDSITERGKRAKYYLDNHTRRYNKPMNSNLISASDLAGQLFVPLTFIDLQSVSNVNYSHDNIYSGVSNGGGELELIITNTLGAFSANCYLYVVLCYYEGVCLDKTGNIIYKKDLFSLI